MFTGTSFGYFIFCCQVTTPMGVPVSPQKQADTTEPCNRHRSGQEVLKTKLMTEFQNNSHNNHGMFRYVLGAHLFKHVHITWRVIKI